MTLHNAWTPGGLPADEPLPKTIKSTTFSSLTETEIKALRTYKDLSDASIEDGEVFLYAAHVQTGLPEGDDFANWQDGSEYHRASTAGGDFKTARRTADHQLVQQADGSIQSTEVKKTGVNVMWLDPTVSPAEFKLVQAVAL